MAVSPLFRTLLYHIFTKSGAAMMSVAVLLTAIVFAWSQSQYFLKIAAKNGRNPLKSATFGRGILLSAKRFSNERAKIAKYYHFCATKKRNSR